MFYYFEALKKYAGFKGRARRSEYWYYTLFNLIIYIILSQFSMLLVGGIGPHPVPLLYYAATFIPSLAVAVRRMHDVGKSGWYLLVPIYNLILAFTEGERRSNEYGEDPKSTA